MKAVLIRRYGGPEAIEVAELERPLAGKGEVVVRVRASSVNPIDWLIRNGSAKLFIRAPFPKVLGVDFSGEVAALGVGAKRFAVGDPVFATVWDHLGANAEYVAIPEAIAALKPKNLTFEEAASAPVGALTALQGLRNEGNLKAGQHVLINGATGGVGMFAVQLAKVLGARVTAVCGKGAENLVRELGADEVINYLTTDFTTQPGRYDVVFDCVGKRTFGECAHLLNVGGSYVTTNPGVGLFVRSAINAITSRKAKAVIMKPSGEDLELIRSWIEKGQVKTIIDKVFKLAEVRDAHAYSQTGRARGKIVLSVQH